MTPRSFASIPSPAPYVFLTGPGCIALYNAYNSWLAQYGYTAPSGSSFYVTFATNSGSFSVSFYQISGSSATLQQTYTESLSSVEDTSWPVISNTSYFYAVPTTTVTISGTFVRSVVAAYNVQLGQLSGASRTSGFAFLTSPYALASFASSSGGVSVRFSQNYLQPGPTRILECYKEQLYTVSSTYGVTQIPCWK
jgi:hypothetical protein